jgi:hypothetical protein
MAYILGWGVLHCMKQAHALFVRTPITHIRITKVELVCHICSNLQSPIPSAQYPSLSIWLWVTTGGSIWASHESRSRECGNLSVPCSCKNSPQPSAVHCTFQLRAFALALSLLIGQGARIHHPQQPWPLSIDRFLVTVFGAACNSAQILRWAKQLWKMLRAIRSKSTTHYNEPRGGPRKKMRRSTLVKREVWVSDGSRIQM